MTTLRLVGLVVLAGLTLSIFFVMYSQLRDMSESKRAKQTVDRLNLAINHVLISGNPEKVKVDVPGDYQLSFEENQIAMDGIGGPENGYPCSIDGPVLNTGEYSLEITARDNRVSIEVSD